MEIPKIRTRPANLVWKRKHYHVAKRLLDFTIALTGLVFLFPAMIVIAIMIRLESPGPALFLQKRIGKDGRAFKIFKFRTMRNHVDDKAHRSFMSAFVRGEIGQDNNRGKVIYKPFRAAEVTRIGRFLRQTSLDELPQLVNVLFGEMSLVGPRPNVPWEVEAYKEWHKERLRVLPGITGLAQVNGRSAITFDVIAQYDIEYVRHQSLGLDLRILINTVLSVVTGSGAS